jgi:hypothetical protein
LVDHTKGGLSLRGFENRVLRRISGPRRNQVTGEWRRLHKEELYAPNASPNINRISKLRRQMSRECSTYGERRGAYRVLVRKPEGRTSLGRPMHSW